GDCRRRALPRQRGHAEQGCEAGGGRPGANAASGGSDGGGDTAGTGPASRGAWTTEDGSLRALLWDTRKLRHDAASPGGGAALAEDGQLFPTKALRKFLGSLTSREAPVLLDLGPVVGSNVVFFGERLGCKILIEDLF